MDLKYYKFYRRSLLKYVKAIGWKIMRGHYETDGMMVPSGKYIQLDKELSQSDEIAAILHELGHTMDDTIMNLGNHQRVEIAYNAIYTKRYTKAQLDLVMATERKAWKYGRVIANMLQIRLGKWYTKYQNQCLRSYRRQE